jgi:hypothetical protein
MKNKILLYCIFFLLAKVTISNAQQIKDNPGQGVSPKPQNVAYMSVIGRKGDKAYITVNDVSGKEVFSKHAEFLETGVNNFAIEPPHQLTKGEYLVTITTSESIFKHKIVIN